MINSIDFMQDIVQVLRMARDPAQKAAIVAELIFSELPETVAFVARRCVLFHWFDRSIIEALLQTFAPPDDEAGSSKLLMMGA